MGLGAGAAVAIAVVAVVVAAYLGTRSGVIGQLDSSLAAMASQYSGRPGPGPGQGASGAGATPPRITIDRDDCDHGLGINGPGEQPFGGPRGFVQLLTPDGAVCRSRGEAAEIPITPAARRVARQGQGRFFANMDVHHSRIRVLVQGIGPPGAVMLALPLTSADNTLSHELLLLLVIGAAGIGLAALLGFLVARAVVAPIARFTRQAERIATNPDRVERERLEVTGRDELARLAHTFNSTLDALEGAIAAQRNLVADASHELRTPIATLRANLQLLRDEERLPPEDRAALRRDMVEELDELTRLVSDVVELARGAKPSAEPGELRLDEILAAALERAERRGSGLTFTAGIEPTLIHGEGNRIDRAITNLLDNAIKWSPAGGVVEVTLRDGVLTVRDHGPGFRPEDLPFIFDRFHRSPEARAKPGSGLGLAIVRQAAEAHGGFAEAANAPDGGALMKVSFGPPLPIADDPSELQGARSNG